MMKNNGKLWKSVENGAKSGLSSEFGALAGQDIYYSSLEFGPENIRSAPSYFHMSRVFQSSSGSYENQAFA